MRRFHECEGPTYILVFAAIVAIAMIENFAAGAGLGMSKEGVENALVGFQMPLALLPLFVKRPWVQVGAPAALLITIFIRGALLSDAGEIGGTRVRTHWAGPRCRARRAC